MELDKLIKLLKSNKTIDISVRDFIGLCYTKTAWFKELLKATGWIKQNFTNSQKSTKRWVH